MKSLFFLISMCFLFSFSASNAQELTTDDSKLIETAGMPLYSDAVFVNGGKDIGYRFATNKSVDEVQKWFKEQLPKWALYNEYGSWMLYDGAPGKGMADIFSLNHIMVKENENMPSWFSLDKNMTTEIVFMVVK